MKKNLGILCTVILCTLISLSVLLAACSDSTDKEAEKTPDATTETSDTPETDTPVATEETEEPAASESPSGLAIDAKDATPYNTKENPVPLGQWVYFQKENYASDKYEPYYLRVVGVSRDQAEVKAAIDAYRGIMDLSLTADQARDIEYGIVEYEVYFAPDYTADKNGIMIPSLTWNATPIKTVMFETKGGMPYVGVGSEYEVDTHDSTFHPQHGDTVREKSLFTVLKNYNESEYVFEMRWYDGEIVDEKRHELYFALSK
jgi:hypothetical protein